MQKIATTHEFWRDLLLMFQNAMIYNMKGSEIYNMAAKLKKFSAKEMEPIFAAEEKMRMALQQNQAPGKRTLRSSSSGIPSQKYWIDSACLAFVNIFCGHLYSLMLLFVPHSIRVFWTTLTVFIKWLLLQNWCLLQRSYPSLEQEQLALNLLKCSAHQRKQGTKSHFCFSFLERMLQLSVGNWSSSICGTWQVLVVFCTCWRTLLWQ